MSRSTSVATGGGVGDGYRPPFTAVQWQELEHQALIYKYLLAGVPVPSDLVVPIRKSLEALSARFFHHPTLSYCSYYGKKFDPEPGRCRRTDGKKWRCSKDAYPNSKYCERHMHRGRNRSRKPVESQSTSQSLLPAMSHITTVSSTGSGNGNGNGSYQSVSSGTFPSPSLYPISNSESFVFRSSVSKLQVDGSPYGINNKDLRHKQGLTINGDDQSHSNLDGKWPLMPMKVPTSYLLEPANDSYIESNSTHPSIAYAFEPVIDAASAALSKQRQQHCFFSRESSPPVQVKPEQDPMRPFF